MRTHQLQNRDMRALGVVQRMIIIGNPPENEDSPITRERSEAVSDESGIDSYGNRP